ncbi:MAG TPA: nuclear transport factor 2 family protein [Conexibacter sp.]|nr:nuclear transport factor 2 family protein [Conexibacter sp.]
MTVASQDALDALDAAGRAVHAAIRAKDRAALEELHDPEFQGAELHGRLINAEEHIDTAMNGQDLELEPFDVSRRVYGDIGLQWGKQTLKGELRPDDPGTTPEWSAAVAKGVIFSFLCVWRLTGGKWRMLTYQVTHLPDEAWPDL